MKLVYFTFIVILMTACSSYHSSKVERLQSSNKELETAAMNVIEQNCLSCHNANSSSGGVGDLTNIDNLIDRRLIIPGDSSQGRLIGSMEDGTMPTSGTLSNEQILIVKTWIDLGFTEDTPPSGPGIDGSPLQKEALTIIQTHCFSCHGISNGSGGVTNILDVQHLIDSKLIVPGDPSQGQLMGSIYDSSMPTGYNLSPEDIKTLEDWITTDVDPNAQTNLPPPEEVKPTFSSISKLILIPKCVACHGPQRADEGIRVDTYDFVMRGDLVKVNDATDSELLKSVEDGEMPPQEDGYQPLTGKEVLAIRDWINSGALNN